MEPEQFLEELKIFALKEMIIPMAPLAEQHRIVAKVDALMSLCDQLEQSQTAAMKLQESYSLAEAMVN
jgi:type I restriction enzyme, S subunit